MTLRSTFDEVRLEQRLARLEEALAGSRPANPQAGAYTRAGGTPPKPTGVVLSSPLGNIRLDWNPVSIPDLKFYEVDVATDLAFTSQAAGSPFKVTSPTFTFEGGAAGTTYYLRVRTVNLDGNASVSSAVANSTTGLVSTGDIDPNAASEIHSFTKTSGFSTLSTNGAEESYGPLVINVFDATSVVLPRLVFEYDFSSVWTGSGDLEFTVELLRRPSGGSDTVIDSATTEVRSTIPTTGGGTSRVVMPSFTTFDQPGAGLFEYRVRVRVTLSGTNVFTFTGVVLRMEFIQSKR